MASGSKRCISSTTRPAGWRENPNTARPRRAAARGTGAGDLTLVGLQMPLLDGISLLHLFRSQSAPSEFIPVLVLTADVSREALKQALLAGATDYLAKPVDVDEVILRVRNL